MSEHYDFHYQPTGSGAISGQQVLQQTEDAINELGDYVNDNVGGAMDVAQQALETAQNAEQDAQTALDTANSFSSAIQSAQQDASTALSTAQTAQTTATNANATAIQAQQDASSAVTTANNASGQVSTLSGTVTALGQRVTTAEGNIGQNTSDITALTTRVGTAEGNITTLQNEVSIAQGNASSAMATAGQVKQQAFVFRYSSTALVDSSTNSNTLLDNTDNLKVGDKVIDSSGVLFSITAIDSVNSTFTVGSALIDLALDANVVHTNEINSSGIGIIEAVKEVGGVDFNTLTTQGLYGTNASGSTNNPENSPCVVQVIKRLKSVIQIASVSFSSYKSRYIRYCADITAQSPVWQSWIKFATDDNVMHLTGNETASGEKTFSDMSSFQGSYLGNEASANARSDLILESNRDTHGQSGIYLTKFRQNKAQGSMSGNDVAYLSFDCLENSVRTNNGFRINFLNFVNDIPQRFILWSGITERLLGVASAPWSDVSTDKINGLEPSALSMPDLANGIDISSYITHLDKVVNNYTPPSNGWLSIRVKKTSLAHTSLMMYQTGGLLSSFETAEFSISGANLPVIANKNVEIYIIADSLASAKFYPCLGNV